MSWAKESAKAGIAGYNPRQAARAALLDPDFQPLQDPLIQELNVSTRFSKFIHIMFMSKMSKYSIIKNVHIYFSHLRDKKIVSHGLCWDSKSVWRW